MPDAETDAKKPKFLITVRLKEMLQWYFFYSYLDEIPLENPSNLW